MKRPTTKITNYSIYSMGSIVHFIRQNIQVILFVSFITSFTIYVFCPKNDEMNLEDNFQLTEVFESTISIPQEINVTPTPLLASKIHSVAEMPQMVGTQVYIVQRPSEGKKKKYSNEPYIPAQYLKDPNSTSLFPWKNSKDEECKGYEINYGLNESFGRRVLVSFPGSGSPFLRFITERATGFFTGKSGNKERNGGFSDPFDGRRILLETDLHSFYNLNDSFHGILLLRNPFNAIIARWKKLNKFEPSADSKRWVSFVNEYIEMWHLGLKMWFEKFPDNDVIFYEDLIEKAPGREMLKMIDFLRIPLDAVRIQCVLKEMEKRKKDFTFYDPVDTPSRLNAYSNHLLKSINQHISSLNHFLKSRGIQLKLDYNT